jgi:ABC-type Fe3+-hydroxamate transport system substrate-binding protein
MKLIIDQTGNQITTEHGFKRIISLVPSITELLFYLEKEKEIVGITDFCIHPKTKISPVQKVGGTKTLDLKKIKQLNPDLIIASKEENTKKQIEELQEDFPVYISAVKSLEGAYSLINDIGELVDQPEAVLSLISEIKNSFSGLSFEKTISVVYLIWENPYMVVGGNTFINEMLKVAGFENVFSQMENYPKVTAKQLQECGAEFFFLSSEPYHFGTEHINHFRALCSCTKVLLVNGEMFGWYGNHMVKAVPYMKNLKTIVTALQKSNS